MRTPWMAIALCVACAEQLAPEAPVVAAPVPAAAPSKAAQLNPEVARTEVEKVIELVQDVTFYHEREQVDGAAELWHRGFERWATVLRGPLAAADAEAALAIEYKFGALRTALESRRGKPKPITVALEAALRASAWRLTGDAPPPPPPAPTPEGGTSAVIAPAAEPPSTKPQQATAPPPKPPTASPAPPPARKAPAAPGAQPG